MPTAPFKLPPATATAPPGTFVFGSTSPLSKFLERAEAILEPAFFTTANESWNVEALALSASLRYNVKAFWTTLNVKELEEAKTARKKAYEEALGGITNAETAQTNAIKVVEKAEKILTEKPGTESEQKLFEAQERRAQAEQGVKAAKSTAEGFLEELKKIEKELGELGLPQLLELIKTTSPIPSVFIELGPIGEPFLIQDLNRKATILGPSPIVELKRTERASTTECVITEIIDQRFDFSGGPFHLGEHGRMQLNVVLTTGANPGGTPAGAAGFGTQLVFPGAEGVELRIIKAGLQYSTSGLAEQRREPRGVRPGR